MLLRGELLLRAILLLDAPRDLQYKVTHCSTL